MLNFLAILLIMGIPTSQPMEQVKGLSSPLVEQNIYAKSKIVKFTVGSSGTKKILCGFAPKLVQVRQTLSHALYFAETDFETTYGGGFFYNGVDDIDTISQDGYFESDAGTFTFTKKLHDGFEINVSSWSGSTPVYFTCNT